MQLRGIPLGSVWGASGVEGFFGEGYWFHKPLKVLGLLDFSGMTFVSKTSTFPPNPGNMELTDQFTSQHPFPDCVWVNPWRGIALNAVGLSGPGFEALLETGSWQARKEPSVISIMAIGKTRRDRLMEVRKFARAIKAEDFDAPYVIQVNVSCPNVGFDTGELLHEGAEILNILGALGVPIVPKFNVFFPPEQAVELSEHESCDAICVSNTMPFDQIPREVKREYFSRGISPLARYGGGGLSGKPLLEYVAEWGRKYRALGGIKPLNLGGGILGANGVDYLIARASLRPGIDSIFLGSIAMLRPWRVKGVIRKARRLLDPVYTPCPQFGEPRHQS